MRAIQRTQLASKHYRHHFVIRGRWHGDTYDVARLFESCICFVDQQLHLARRAAFRQADVQMLRADGNELADRAFHHHGVCEIDQVNDHSVVLLPSGDVEDTRAGSTDDVRLIERPANNVGQNSAVVGVEFFPERAFDVTGEISDAARAKFTQVNFADIRTRFPWE